LFEQFIICEAYRAIHYAESEARIFFWCTSNGAEVDLILEKHGAIITAIEIKSQRHITSDCSGLRSFHEDYPRAPLFVACTAPNRYDLNGITVYPWQELLRALHDVL
jgi:hypothetical protein